jgi:hypothetical protein
VSKIGYRLIKTVSEPLSSSEGGEQWKSKTRGGKTPLKKPILVRRTVLFTFIVLKIYFTPYFFFILNF